MKVKCKFGVPNHGWLQFVFSVDAFELDIDISDVPMNPIDALVSALLCALDGLDAEVWLHLEPGGYHLRFVPLPAEQLRLRIEFSDRDTRAQIHRSIVFDKVGEKREIILPIWRALKEFDSHSYREPAWPKCDAVRLEQLEKRIKGKSVA
jgi:hypothetical protein